MRCRVLGHRNARYMGVKCVRCGAWWVFNRWVLV